MTPSEAPLLLCTNDDGIHAAGLSVLTDVAERLGDVRVVAPDRQQSASSHALTLDRPLRVTKSTAHRYAVDGTPTDCVLLAIKETLERIPDFVLSGVNHGSNMGEDVLYSGTVAAAMEATILGVPAAAFSFTGRDPEILATYDGVIERLIASFLARDPFPDETFMNVNLPDCPAEEVEGVRVTSLGRRVYYDSLTRSEDPSGHDYFWIGGGHSDWRGRDDSDFRAVRARCVSVTPMHLDLTNYRLMQEVDAWSLEV